MPIVPWENKPLLGAQLDLTNPITKGLKILWLMNEGKGKFLYSLSRDLVTIDHEATITTAQWVGGKFGWALNFDGSNDFISMSNASAFHVDHLTFSVWVRSDTTDFSATNRVIVSDNDGTDLEWQLFARDTNVVRLRVDVTGGAFDVVDTTAFFTSSSKWYHIVATYDGTTMVIYVDGVEDVSKAHGTGGVIDTAANQFRFGSNHQTTVRWDGGIDNIAIWDRALNPREVFSLYSNPWQMFTPMFDPAMFMRIAAAGGLSIPVAMNQYRRQHLNPW